ncbi:MAG: UDP-galactopyranose mutase [Pirellulales bacterium]
MAGYDYLVVGCGMFGAVFARSVAERGRRVLVVDKRPHVAGNCYSEHVAGVQVHRYGPHIFHTDNPRVWWFVTRFARFNDYRHRGCVNYQGRRYSFPLNLTTLEQVWGVSTPEDAERKLREVRVAHDSPQNLRDWIVSQVGVELYEIFVRGYTTKQWGRDPADLPAAIIRRLPIRTTRNDAYFDDRFQGIPVGGYTLMFERMLDHPRIDVRLNVDYFADRARLERLAMRTVYTGKIDELFDYRFGELEYRSLRFENEVLDQQDYQGAAIVNYTEQAVPHTRITEHKHFECGPAGVDSHPSRQTVITREYPAPYHRGETPYYPIRDAANSALYERYRQAADQSSVLLGGRLGTYQYYDMHQVVAQAMAMAQRETSSPQRLVPAPVERPAA